VDSLTDHHLTPRQRRFVAEYVVDLNAAAAARRAGYSARSAKETAYDLLRRPAVQAAIAREQARLRERTEVTQEYVIAAIRETLERCRQEESYDARAVLRAAELLGRHLGMWVERVHHTGSVATVAQDLSDEELAALVASRDRDDARDACH